MPERVPAFHAASEGHTAGSPVREEVPWKGLTPEEIRATLMESALQVSEHIVRRLLREAGYRVRQMPEYPDTGGHADRDARFENTARIQGCRQGGGRHFDEPADTDGGVDPATAFEGAERRCPESPAVIEKVVPKDFVSPRRPSTGRSRTRRRLPGTATGLNSAANRVIMR